MWRRYAYWSGVVLILTAIAAGPSVAIVPSYVGGSALDGHVEDGRYFVNPSHGRPIVEVSESTWRAVWWVERLWPFSALGPGLLSGVVRPQEGTSMATASPEQTVQARPGSSPRRATAMIALAWLPAIILAASLPRFVPTFDHWPRELPPLTLALMPVGRLG